MIFVVSLAFAPPLIGLLVALATAGALTALAIVKSTDVALWMIAARPAHPVEHARLHNLVESLCFSSGLPKPGVHVVEDSSVNAFAAGRGPRHAAIGVTSGLLGSFTPVELEAVLAHELSRVKSYDVVISTLAVTMLGLAASPLPDHISTRLVIAAAGARQDFVADITGVSLTRYPPGLISALEKVRRNEALVPVRSAASAHFWLQPFGPAADAGRDETGPSRLEARIEALREL
ncbi:MAG: M48 family metalloprotease [Actinomycetota bacterium]|nr:M48 family metalloprotease [Actinomycetota bacterium]